MLKEAKTKRKNGLTTRRSMIWSCKHEYKSMMKMYKIPDKIINFITNPMGKLERWNWKEVKS